MIRAAAGATSAVDAAVVKVVFSETNLALATLGVEWQGADGVVAAPDSRREVGHWQEAFLWARGFTISAGSTEIMHNLIAETGLGLPREPRPAIDGGPAMTMTAAERADFRALCADFFARQAGQARLRRYLETPAPGFDQPLWTDLRSWGWSSPPCPRTSTAAAPGCRTSSWRRRKAGRALHGAPLATTLTAARVLAPVRIPPRAPGGPGGVRGGGRGRLPARPRP